MSYLLDTNVVSELRKRPEIADARVTGWARRRQVRELFVSVITVMEIEIGVARIERRDSRQGLILRTWFEDSVVGAFDGRILSVNLEVVRRTALFHVPDLRPERDAFIAATAAVHGLTVVTRNVADFRHADVPLLNPWTA